MKQDLIHDFLKRVVARLRDGGMGERIVKLVSDDTIEYNGYWIHTEADGKRCRLNVEKGSNLREVREGLPRILKSAPIEEKYKKVFNKYEVLEREDGGVSLVLYKTKINEKERIYNAFYHAGMKWIFLTIHRAR